MKPKDSARQPILPFDTSAPPAPPDEFAPSSADAPRPEPSRTPAQVPSGASVHAPSGASAPVPSGASARTSSSAPAQARRTEGFLPELLLFLAAALVLGVGLASVPLLDPDEARYASASRAMLERGDLVVPYFNGAERLNKPVLFYWLQASSFHLFGTTAGAARAPSALAALAIVVAVTLFARRTFGPAAGRRAGLILLTIPLFAVVGKTGITDMTLALFTVGAMLLWYRLHIGDGGESASAPATPAPATTAAPATSGARRRLLWLGVSLCLGLAFFVKGPVGILVPCFVIGAYLVLRREWSGFRLRGILLGGVVALGVFLPWAVMLVYRLGAQAAAGAGLSSILLAGVGRVSELLRRETIDRTLHGMDHPEPLHYYWLASIVIFFPWIAWIPSAIAKVFPRLRRLEPATLYLVTWLIGVLVFFTAIRGKLVTYVLPAAPAIALLLGREWARAGTGDGPESDARAARDTRWIAIGSVVLVAAMIALVGFAAATNPPWLEGHYLLADGLALALALAAAVPLFLRRPGAVNFSVAAVMAATLVAVPLIAGRGIGEKRSLAALAHDAGFRDHSWTRVISYKMFRPSLVFYGGHEVTYIDSARALHEALTPGCLVVLEQRRFDDLPPAWQSALRTIATQGDVLAMTPVIMLPQGNEPRP
jgi:4-amino-4-deoxy-L-arabinose transferase-like glycosyltransferase